MSDLPDWLNSGPSTGTSTATDDVVPAPPPPKTPLPDWLEGDNSQLRGSLQAGSKIPPEQAAKVLQLKDQTGLPTSLVARNTDQIQQQTTAQQVNPDDFQKAHPVVSDWLSEDPHHAAVAGSDIPVLGTLERQFHYLTTQAERGVFDVERSYLGMKSFLGMSNDQDEQRRELIERRLGTDLNLKAPGIVSKVFGGVVESAPQLAGVMGLAGLASLAAGAGGAAAVTAGAFGALEAGNSYLDFRNKKDAQGNPISESEARGWATVSGVLNGAASIIPVGKMMEQIPGFRMLGREGINGILENPTARAAFRDYIKGIGESSLTMGGFSGFGTLVHNAAGELAQMQGDGSLKTSSPMTILSRVFSPENLKAAAASAGSGTATGAVFGGTLGTFGLYRDLGRAQEAQATSTSWKNIGATIQGTKMFDMAPDQMEKVVSRIAPDSHVFIPLDKWQSYWEGKKIDPRAVYQEVAGTTKGYDDALRSGIDLQIPASRYATTIAPSEHNEFFSNVLRSDPQAMNAEESQQAMGIKSEEEKKVEASGKIADSITGGEPGGKKPEVSAQGQEGPSTTEQVPPLQKGTTPESEATQRTVFPGPVEPSLKDITSKPQYVKMRADAAEVVNRYAKARGIDPTPELATSLFQELHDALGEVRKAKPEERVEVAKRIMAEHPQIESDFLKLKEQLYSDKTDGYFERFIAPREVKEEPKGLSIVKPDEEALNAKGKPFALFIGNQPGEGAMYNVYGEHPTLSSGRYQHSTVTAETLAKEGIPITGREARVAEGVVPQTKEEAQVARVKEVQDQQGMKPLFPQPTAMGMDVEKAARYKEAIERARGRAQEDIVRQITDRKLKEKSSSWMAERSEIEKTVTQEAAQRPEYRAFDFLKSDADTVTEQGLKTFKLDRQDVIDNDPTNSTKGYPTGIMADKGGVKSDIAAQVLGFKSGSELLYNLKTMVPKVDFINQEVDQRMMERHPDASSGVNLIEQAMKAVHNEDRAKVLRLELEHLASNDFAVFKGLVKAIGRRIPTIQEVRNDAEDTIGSKTTAETLPHLYQRAESVAGREAQENFLRGDFEKAFESKKAELLNHELYRAAQNAKEQTQKDISYQQKFDSSTVLARIGKAGSDYLEQIQDLRNRFDFSRTTLKDLGKRQSLRDFVEDQRKMGYEPDIPPELLNESNKKSWREMSNDELHQVVDSMRNIDHLSGLKNKLMTIQKERTYDEVINNVTSSIEKNFKLDPDAPPKPIDLHPSFTDRIAKGLADFGAWRTKMEFLFRFMDKGEYHGPVWETFFKPMNDAEDSKTSRMREAVGSMDEMFKDYSRSERAKFYSRLTHIPEINMDMNKMDMMMTVLHWGNEGNRAELLRGYGWNESQVKAIWKNLDSRDFKTVGKIWKFIDSFWPEISKQERDLNGLVPEKIQASPFDVALKDGSTMKMDGGYFPLVYDKNISWRTAALGQDEMVKDLFAGGAGRAATKHGWTNERVGGGGQAPSLNMSTWVNHIGDVIHDLSYRKPVIDLYKLINDDQIRKSIEASAGRELYKQLNPWLKRTAGDRPWNPLGPLEALSTVRSNMTAAELGLKFTSAFIHASSYLVAGRELGPKYALLGLKDSADIRSTWNFVQDKSEFMRSRPDNFDRDIRSAGRDLNIAGVSDSMLSELKAYSPLKRSAFWGIMRGVDLGIAVPTWMGAYRKAMEGGVKNIESGNEPEAIEYADQLVRDTKGSGAAKDLAPIQSAGGELGKLFTMFYTQLNVIDNQFMQAYREFKVDKNIPKIMTTAAMTWFLPAAATELLRGKTPTDDEGWGKWLAKAELLYPASMIPGLREVVSFWQRGDLQASPVFEAIKTMAKTAQNAAQSTPLLKEVAGEKDEWTDKDYQDALMTAGYSTGLPTRQAIKTTQYLYDWMTGAEQPDNPMERIWRSMVGKKFNG